MATNPAFAVSAIIVTRNTRPLTCAAVRSVVAGQDGLAAEVIVVDNASTDDTAEVMRRDFPGVKFLRSESNLGFARANNLGGAAASGEFLLLLNSDARLKPDTLELAVAWMKQHPECAVAGAQLLNADGSLQNSIANFPSLATELLNKSLLRRLFPKRFPGKERGFNQPVEVESVIGAFMLIRGKVWRELGGLDERYFFFLEETDFCFQVRRRGWKVFHLPQVQVWHDQGQSARHWPAAARIEYWRSRYAYFQKNCGPFARSLLRVGLAVRLFVTWLVSGLLVLVTLGASARLRKQWHVNYSLGCWHLRNCPAGAGLPR